VIATLPQLANLGEISSTHKPKGRFRAADRRKLVAAQCRLLAARAEGGLPPDPRSLVNLVRAYRDLLLSEACQ
jgi:hypothetical protein